MSNFVGAVGSQSNYARADICSCPLFTCNVCTFDKKCKAAFIRKLLNTTDDELQKDVYDYTNIKLSEAYWTRMTNALKR